MLDGFSPKMIKQLEAKELRGGSENGNKHFTSAGRVRL
jgi:hypothetical protein